MTELTLTNFNGIETVDSRLVAEAIDKPHNDLMKDIRRYCEYLGEGKISHTDFFIESNYTTSQNKILPCYLCTRKGCEMIANKMTGAKGTVFTAMYINAFHSMEQNLTEPKPELDIQEKTKVAEILLKTAQLEGISEWTRNRIASEIAEMLTSGKIQQKTEKHYSATEIGEMFGVSAQRIGRLSTEYNMKTDEYGEWYRDVAKNSHKEIETFRYNAKAVEKFREIIK